MLLQFPTRNKNLTNLIIVTTLTRKSDDFGMNPTILEWEYNPTKWSLKSKLQWKYHRIHSPFWKTSNMSSKLHEKIMKNMSFKLSEPISSFNVHQRLTVQCLKSTLFSRPHKIRCRICLPWRTLLMTHFHLQDTSLQEYSQVFPEYPAPWTTWAVGCSVTIYIYKCPHQTRLYTELGVIGWSRRLRYPGDQVDASFMTKGTIFSSKVLHFYLIIQLSISVRTSLQTEIPNSSNLHYFKTQLASIWSRSCDWLKHRIFYIYIKAVTIQR